MKYDYRLSRTMKKLNVGDIVEDIYRSLDAGAYLSALALALTIPDTLAQITYPELKGRGHVKDRYVRWINEYYICRPEPSEEHDSECTRIMNGVIDNINGDFFFELRNSFLHSDSNDVTRHMADLDFELSFEDGCATSVFGSGDCYWKHHVLSVPDFCKTVCAIAEHLLEKWKYDTEKQALLDKFGIKLWRYDEPGSD